MKAIDFKGTTPHLAIEDYFLGETRAWGMFEDRFGRMRRQFSVEISGYWEGAELVLGELFHYSDGEFDRRVWRIRKISEHSYEGVADDMIGMAKGEAYGNALNWQYDMNLKIGARTMRVHFDDWMFLQPSGVLLNRARVSKLSVAIGTVTLAFMKRGAAKAAANLNDWPRAVARLQGANQ